jgi:hypothetical protein
MNKLRALGLGGVLLLGACGEEPPPPPPPGDVTLALELVADGLDSPVYVTAPPGDDRLFIVEQPGVIRIVKDGVLLATPFLDIQNRVRFDGFQGEERGLFSIAFHPDFANNGKFYVNYSADVADVNQGTDLTISEFVATGGGDVADPDTENPLIVIDHRAFFNHNGGTVNIGPDGFLYVSTGDGGGANDPFNASQQKADDPATANANEELLGKILRLDIENIGQIPADNPFDNNIFQFGLRNPFRFSFDRQTGDMYIGDVGQGFDNNTNFEEFNFAPAGAQSGINWGWSCQEGLGFFNPDLSDRCGDQDNFTNPFFEISGDDGARSAIGGYVYRGAALTGFEGKYFFTDAFLGRVLTTRVVDGTAEEVVDVSDQVGVLDFPVSFGEDADGELYIVQIGGEVFKFVPAE